MSHEKWFLFRVQANLSSPPEPLVSGASRKEADVVLARYMTRAEDDGYVLAAVASGDCKYCVVYGVWRADGHVTLDECEEIFASSREAVQEHAEKWFQREH